MAGSDRTKAGQSKHDREVLKIARELKKEDYKVQADIKGYPKPSKRGLYRPDVIATKGKKEIIVEVETVDSANSPRDLAQQKAFKRAAEKSGAKFKRKIV
jgi:hypothetical protein